MQDIDLVICQEQNVYPRLILRIFSCPEHQALSEVSVERAITRSQFCNLAGVPGSMGSKMHLDLRTLNGQLTDQSLQYLFETRLITLCGPELQ